MQKHVSPLSLLSVFIELYADANLVASGTAFLAKTATQHYLMTSRHLFADAPSINGEPPHPMHKPNFVVVWYKKRGEVLDWVPKREQLYRDGGPAWKDHPTLGARANFAALRVTPADDTELLAYDLFANDDLFDVGLTDPVSVIGFPFGITAHGKIAAWATGTIASDPGVDFHNLPVQLIDCRTRPFQTGAPVLAYRAPTVPIEKNGGLLVRTGPTHRFIGMYGGRLYADSDLGIVWKKSALSDLLLSLDAPPLPEKTDALGNKPNWGGMTRTQAVRRVRSREK